MTSFRPPMPVSLDDITSIRQPWRSAYFEYMRNSSAAKSAASSPPVPARISRTTFFSSFGSFGTSRTFRSATSASRRATSALSSSCASSRMSGSPPDASSSVWAMSRVTSCTRGSARRSARSRTAPSRASGTQPDRSAPRPSRRAPSSSSYWCSIAASLSNIKTCRSGVRRAPFGGARSNDERANVER